jgi:hypothetical protein
MASPSIAPTQYLNRSWSPSLLKFAAAERSPDIDESQNLYVICYLICEYLISELLWARMAEERRKGKAG